MSYFTNLMERLFTTPYHPQAEYHGYMSRAETRTQDGVEVTVAVPDAQEGRRIFGIPLAGKGLQPVWVRVKNGSQSVLRAQFLTIDPRYFPPLEAAARCHFSIVKRISTFGVVGWVFAPMLLLMPLKLLTAHWANQRMDTLFQDQSLHRRPIAPGETVEGFIYTSLDSGTKIIRIYLMAISQVNHDEAGPLYSSMVRSESLVSDADSSSRDIDLTFSMPVPNLALDYEHQELLNRVKAAPREDGDIDHLIEQLKLVSTVVSNQSGRGTGDPVNLVIIGSFETLLLSFIGRWDETEAITLATCWKTAKAFLLGEEYRYSPVSPLFLFGRSQDIALQQIRNSINVRMHLRLWLAPFQLKDQPVWVGQVSRDIGVRFTTKVWNLTTHRIDPDVDEARDYVLEDLLDVERVEAAGHMVATPPVTRAAPHHNLTGDPYYTDGKRVVILLAQSPGRPRFIDWT